MIRPGRYRHFGAFSNTTFWIVEEQSVNDLQSQQFVELRGVVPTPAYVALDHSLQTFPIDVWPGKAARVEKNLHNIAGESIPVPGPEMIDLVSPEENAFQAEVRKGVVEPGQPLGHSHITSVFGLEEDLEKAMGDGRGEMPSIASHAAVGRNAGKSRVAIGN